MFAIHIHAHAHTLAGSFTREHPHIESFSIVALLDTPYFRTDVLSIDLHVAMHVFNESPPQREHAQ